MSSLESHIALSLAAVVRECSSSIILPLTSREPAKSGGRLALKSSKAELVSSSISVRVQGQALVNSKRAHCGQALRKSQKVSPRARARARRARLVGLQQRLVVEVLLRAAWNEAIQEDR